LLSRSYERGTVEQHADRRVGRRGRRTCPHTANVPHFSPGVLNLVRPARPQFGVIEIGRDCLHWPRYRALCLVSDPVVRSNLNLTTVRLKHFGPSTLTQRYAVIIFGIVLDDLNVEWCGGHNYHNDWNETWDGSRHHKDRGLASWPVNSFCY